MSPPAIKNDPSSPSEPKPAPTSAAAPTDVKMEVGVGKAEGAGKSDVDEGGEGAKGGGQAKGEGKEGDSTPSMAPPAIKDDASSPSEPNLAPKSAAAPGSIAIVDVKTKVEAEVKESVAERGVGPSQGKKDDEDCGGFPGGPSKHSSWYSTPEMEKEWEKEWAEQCKNSRGLFAFMPPGSKGVGLTMEGGKGKGEGSGGDGKSE